MNKMLRMPFLSVLRKWTAPLAPECLPPAPSPKGEALPEKTVSSSSLRETASVARVVEEVVIPQAEKAEAHLKVVIEWLAIGGPGFPWTNEQRGCQERRAPRGMSTDI